MKKLESEPVVMKKIGLYTSQTIIRAQMLVCWMRRSIRERFLNGNSGDCERGDVPGWVLVVLMTTGLVTAIWTIAAPRLTAILRNSLDSMNGIR